MTRTEATEPATELARAEKATLLGGAGAILAAIAHATESTSAAWLACACLAVAAVMGLSAGWVWGLTPLRTAPAAQSAGLVGSLFTVLDDATSSAAAALRGGGRCSVMAVDGARIGVLFLELDRAGRVVAAATAERDWDVAGAVKV